MQIAKGTRLQDAYLQAYQDIVAQDLLGAEDLGCSEAWIKDLENLGYEFPELIKNAPVYRLFDSV